MNFSRTMLLLYGAIFLVSPHSTYSGEKFSFSGHVRVNTGCLEIVAAPIRNATVAIHNNQSCIIDAMPKRKVSPSFVYQTTTDSAGYYCFENLDADSFTCYPIQQIVEVEAEGYYTQRRDILPGRDSILDFDLLGTSADSMVIVTVSVIAVDTNAVCEGTRYCSPIPLANYRIEIPDRYLFWFSPQIMDTTDENGKAEFTLKVVPYVDYLLEAKPLNNDNHSGAIVANIASCMGNNVTIPVHIPGTTVRQGRSRGNNSFTVECRANRSRRGTVITLRSMESEYGQYRIFVDMFDMKGRPVGAFEKTAGRATPARGQSFTLNTSDLPAGMYLLKIQTGNGTFSEQLLLRR